MTNREWLFNKMQNMSDEEFAGMVRIHCAMGCDFCEAKDKSCLDCKIDWMKQKHKEKITLSEAERVILENIPEEYKLIARDNDGTLKIGADKLEKSDRGFWYHESCSKYTNLEVFNHLFQFITWEDEEPYNIAELLKGE